MIEKNNVLIFSKKDWSQKKDCVWQNSDSEPHKYNAVEK